MKKTILVLLATLSLTACSYNSITTPTIASTKNHNFYNKKLQLGKQVTGLSNNPQPAYRPQEAIDDALSKNNCAVALINIKSLSKWGGHIEGTEVIDPSIGNCAK